MMNIPQELKYSSDHEWIRVEGSRAVIGITDFAQSQLGDVVFVELPAAGTKVVAGQSFSVIESVKAVSDIFAPISGVVVEVNETLAGAPEPINQDPYGQGWIVVIEIADKAELEKLLDSEGYEKITVEGGH